MGKQQLQWAANRNAEIILQILCQAITVVDLGRQNDFNPSECQRWIDTIYKVGKWLKSPGRRPL